MPLYNGHLSNKTLGFTYDSAQVYKVGDVVVYSGAMYICISANSGQVPTNTAYWNPTTSASSGTNFISNSNAESGTIGYATYADAAQSSPVNGTGGTANITFTRSTSSPLIGSGSFLLTKDAANRQGQGVSYDFSIDSAYQAKVLQISMEMAVASGTFVAGSSTTDSDITVWIYDVTNSVLIQPSTTKFYSNSALSSTFTSSFQTPSNSTSYRLIMHVASTSTAAYSVKFDNISVSPTSYVYGSPITDWQSYTPTFTGFGTVSNAAFYYRRVGSDIQVRGTVTTGTVTATQAQITLPSGLTSASSTIISSTYESGFFHPDLTSAQYSNGTVLVTASQAYVTLGMTAGGTSFGNSSLVAQNGTVVLGNALKYSFNFSVPIQGFSSSVQMSDSADMRVIAASYSGNAGTSVTASVTNIPFTTLEQDTHSAWNGSVFTAPVSGFYQFRGSFYSSGATGEQIDVYIDGTQSKRTSMNLASSTIKPFGGMVYVNAGQQISFRSTGTLTITNSAAYHWITINRLSGPSAIAATETIAASYTTSGSSTPGAGVQTNFVTKVLDTHNTVTTGASWKFTAPAAGTYDVSCVILTTAGNGSQISVYKNGSSFQFLTASGTNLYTSGSTLVPLLAGEYIDIRPTSGTITSGTLSVVNIKRIGL